MPIRDAEPMSKERGKFRCALMASPALKVTYCHPSYAHKTPIIAKPTPEKIDFAPTFAGEPDETAANPWPSRHSTRLITRIAVTLMAVVQSWRFALSLVPITFTTVTITIMAIAASLATMGETGTISPR